MGKYDIFISYRRRASADKAEHLLSLLSENGYRGRVSFDKDNFSGRFDLEIIKRVDECKDFIIILGKDSLQELEERDTPQLLRLSVCPVEDFNQLEDGLLRKDYVRIELARAIAKKKNIIPVVPQDSQDYSFSRLELPADIRDLTKFQAVFYSDQDNCFLFQDIVPKILSKLVSRPSHRKGTAFSGRNALSALIIFLVAGFLFLFVRDYAFFRGLPETREGMERYLQSDRYPRFFTGKENRRLQVIDAAERDIRTLPRFDAFSFSPEITPVQALTVSKILHSMVYIHGGTFTMGADPEGKAKDLGISVSIKEQPLHPETVGDFWMGKYEVSADEWAGIMLNKQTEPIDFPVTQVSWEDADDFCRELQKLTGLPFQLPSEAMWEYAAKAGDDFLFAGSDRPEEVAWYQDREGAGDKPHVRNDRKGGLLCNSFELYDLSGNVAEWCQDAYVPYDEVEPEDSQVKVIRGGCVTDPPRKITTTYRDPLNAQQKSEFVGFRLSIPAL